MPDPWVEDLERAAARHWQAPDTERLGGWLLRAADGFTGRANSALPLGDPGVPLPEAVTAVGDWYRRRRLRPMIVLPRGAGPDPLESLLTERGWVPRPGPAFVMTADMADIPPGRARVEFTPEPDAAFLGLYRHRGRLRPRLTQRRHEPYVLWVIAGTRYVCEYGGPCPQRICPLARRAGRGCLRDASSLFGGFLDS